MARAVDMSIVPLFGFIFHVGHVNGDRLCGVTDRTTLGDLCIALELGKSLPGLHRQNRTGQRGLAMVNVTDRPYVDVGLRPNKYILSHSRSISVLWSGTSNLSYLITQSTQPAGSETQ
ncbi:hypothetical protein THTE_3508 [Thermogutta terrifontis]|uniref:Uncharacterized protein n=1 Tax=Thermogutta terrifontis TaxID=1331910 RepID=A0A286RJG7_9BACT|nr:hypothetical protein THTE_3508 [Thermogutta terrifontis]